MLSWDENGRGKTTKRLSDLGTRRKKTNRKTKEKYINGSTAYKWVYKRYEDGRDWRTVIQTKKEIGKNEVITMV